MARKEKDLKEKTSKTDTVRKKTKKDEAEEETGSFAPLNVAVTIQKQIKEFKVC